MTAKKTTKTSAQSARKAPKKTARTPSPSKNDGVSQKLSALDAAVRVLGETKAALSCQQLIEAMTAQGYWTSPGGKTPHATLYASITREIQTKGAKARFQKTGPGRFMLA
jgi:hypothetical protein